MTERDKVAQRFAVYRLIEFLMIIRKKMKIIDGTWGPTRATRGQCNKAWLLPVQRLK